MKHELPKAFQDLVKKHNLDPLKAFDDLLTYILRFLSIDEQEVAWEHGPEVNESFKEVFEVYLQDLDSALETLPWYDAWGDLFMELSGNYKSFRGQFFTPPGASDVLARIAGSQRHLEDYFVHPTINDCACGSARMLLAANAEAARRQMQQPYLIGEDIDNLCCKMAAINFCVHGCVGEVIRHDTIRHPDELTYGYLVNVSSVPSIRTSKDKSDFRKFAV